MGDYRIEPLEIYVYIDSNINDSCFVEPVLKKEAKTKPRKIPIPNPPELTPKERAARDLSEMMEFPFLALSKNRKKPIIYEKHDGKNMMRVKVTCQ